MTRKLTLLISALSMSVVVAGCNTVKGLGEDIQSVGRAGEEAINWGQSTGCQVTPALTGGRFGFGGSVLSVNKYQVIGRHLIASGSLEPSRIRHRIHVIQVPQPPFAVAAP